MEVVFLGDAMESILDDGKVSSGHTRVTTKKKITFDPNYGSRLNVYRSFRRLIS
jgi:hypothetical protein